MALVPLLSTVGTITVKINVTISDYVRRQLVAAAPQFQFATCLDRPYVQKEIGWARKYNKKIIILVEKEQHRPGFFDYTKAAEKYAGTEWEEQTKTGGLRVDTRTRRLQTRGITWAPTQPFCPRS